jgi:TetR/AcrR family transcriptional regulator, mexJK operon transcriptional repressor
MRKPTPSRIGRPGAGRPTRDEAARRQDYLLECALEEFLDKGYEGATIESIAGTAGMAKRTIYAKFDDKAALFRAAVGRAIDDLNIDVATLRELKTDDLTETLTALARVRVAAVTSPEGVRLQRILNAESYRFPDVMGLAWERGTGPIVRLVVEVLAEHAATGAIEDENPEILGTSFMSLVVGGPAQAAIRGTRITPSPEEWIRVCVRLFLDGARPR